MTIKSTFYPGMDIEIIARFTGRRKYFRNLPAPKIVISKYSKSISFKLERFGKQIGIFDFKAYSINMNGQGIRAKDFKGYALTIL